MKRKIYKELLKWKDSEFRKPLILKGARQVGKSWILRHFGENEYKYLAYISCDNSIIAASLFSDYNIERILRNVEAICKVPVLPGETLIVFDEIQEIPQGLTSLKYFCENYPDYHVAVAGSLLGITLNRGNSFPVGKVDFLEMYPMDFEEFLWAIDETYKSEIIKDPSMLTNDDTLKSYEDLLRQYYFCGGMPEAVKAYSEKRGILEVRKIQKNILEAYNNDISKHTSLKDAQRIHLVMQTLPAQLAKENKKFIYSAIRKGARASEFEIAIQWLVDAGILYKVTRISKPGIPLKFYEDFNAFKLFLLDAGLYGALVEADPSYIFLQDNFFTEYKGAFTELYVCQQLISTGFKPYYYSKDDSRVEIDFIISEKDKIIPIEVKAEGNVKGKSLKLFVEKFDIKESVRFSMLPYKQQEKLINVPLCAVFALKNYLHH